MNPEIRFGLLVFLPLNYLMGCGAMEKYCGGSRHEASPGGKIVNESIRYSEMTREALSTQLKAGTITLIDANGSESYSEGHIPGALDFESLKANPGALPQDRSTPLVVYCGGPRCGAWKSAAEDLTAMGYTRISHYPGGLMGWSEAGMPLDSGISTYEAGETSHAIPTSRIAGCKLSRGEQEKRIAALRAGIFAKVDSVMEAPGSLRLRFPDNPENVAELTDFVRSESECCPGSRFSLVWERQTGAVVLEMKGPADLLAAVKEAANR